MLDDRHYMRPGYGGSVRWTASPTLVLLALNTAVFVLQQINHVYIQSPVEAYLTLSATGLSRGWVWQLISFQFLHFSFWHFFMNSLGIYFLGRMLESVLGVGRFYEVYFASGTVGGILQGGLGMLFPMHFGGPVMGASAGLSGLLAVFCMLHRNETIQVFFVFPVRAWYVLIASLAIAGFFVLVPSESGVAHAAHLGGLLAGIAYVQWILQRERRLFNWRPYADLVGAERKTRAAPSRKFSLQRPKAEPADLPPEEFISQEVDPILDKISAHGIHSLTERERKILDRARAKMAKR